MIKCSAATVALVVLFSISSASAENGEPKEQKHHKLSDWLSILSAESREKLRAAKGEALKDPAVAAAKQRRDQAEAEYCELLHREILKTDPSLAPLLQKITELKKHEDL